MKKAGSARVCMLPRLSGVSGMASFQHRLAAGLAARGVEVCYDLSDEPYAAVLVIGGTRQLAGVWRARQRGIPIIQRLDGMNWIHRRRRTGLRHFLRAEYGNTLLALIRAHLADKVVYQSEFARCWWEQVRGPTHGPFAVIYNGVDLTTFTPDGQADRPDDRFRLLLVEGSLMGGYEQGLENAVALAQQVRDQGCLAHRQRMKEKEAPVELMVVGRVTPELHSHWEKRAGVPLFWAGVVPRARIPAIDRSAHVLFSADIQAACPNSVIEALACGTPVVAFDTGALAEIVTAEAGKVVNYGSNAWQLEAPDIPALAEATIEILQNQERYRRGARARAEDAFGLEQMVDRYWEVLFDQ